MTRLWLTKDIRHLVREDAPTETGQQIPDPNTSKGSDIWSNVHKVGSTPGHTDWLTVRRKVTFTLIYDRAVGKATGRPGFDSLTGQKLRGVLSHQSRCYCLILSVAGPKADHWTPSSVKDMEAWKPYVRKGPRFLEVCCFSLDHRLARWNITATTHWTCVLRWWVRIFAEILVTLANFQLFASVLAGKFRSRLLTCQ
jgi:hypothetical protein